MKAKEKGNGDAARNGCTAIMEGEGGLNKIKKV